MRKRFFFLFISLYCIAVKAQSLEETFSFASKQFHEQNYSLAIENYQRVIYFGNDSLRLTCYRELSNCYANTGAYEESNRYADLAYFLEKNDSAKNELLLLRTANLMHLKNFKAALIELFSMNEPLPASQLRNQQAYFGMIYFGSGNYEKSELYFLEVVKGDSLKEEMIRHFFVQNKKVNHIHPTTAMILSLIIPGLGQLYAGDVRNGLNSLLLNVGFAALFYNTAVNASLFDAIVTVFPWYFRYFNGGYKHAESIAIKRIETKRSAIFDKIVNTL